MKAEAIAAADEDGSQVEAGGDAARGDADVDDALAPAVEDGVHERAEPRRLAGRPGEGAVEEVEDAAEDDEDAGEDPGLGGRDDRGDDRDPEADQRQGVRGEPDLADRERDRRRRCRGRGRGGSGDDERSRGGLLAAGGAGEAEDGRLAGGERLEGLRHGAGRPSRGRSGGSSTRPGGAEPADVPRDERLRQADLGDELGDAAPRRSARRRTIRRRFTSARALWTRRSSRSSSGWTTADAIVERMRAGDGDRGRSPFRGNAVASTTVYINRG